MKKILMHITTLLLLAFVNPALFAQASFGRIQGIVEDAVTKEALAGVNIQIIDSKRGATTDQNGNFSIENLAPGIYRLQFEYIGYAPRKVTDIIVAANKPVTLKVELTEELLESETITVSAGYFVEEMMPQPSILSLSREEIRRFPGGFEDVVRTVSTLPGVAINESGGRNDLLVRGGGPSENLFIINNIEIPNINHFGTQGSSSGSLSFINLDFVDNIIFSTGGFSVRYGDKMSSTLSLDLARGRNDRLGSKLLISATQFGANIEGPLGDNGDFIFSARQSYLDLIFKAAGLPFIPVYTDFNFILNYDLSPRDKLFILGLAAIDRVDRDQSSEENRVFNAGILDNTQNQYITGVNYRHILDNGYYDVSANINIYDFDFTQIDENLEPYFDSSADEIESGLKLMRFWSLSENLSLLGGLSAKYIQNKNNTVFADTIYNRSGNRIPLASIGLQPQSDLNKKTSKYAFFTEFEWRPGSGIDLVLGVRGNYYDFLEEPFYFSPRLIMKIQSGDQISYKASVGVYHQPPSYVWTVNPENRNLKALQNTMGILGMDYLLQDDLRMSIEGYYKHYTDLPTGTIPGVNDYLVITNTGTGYGGREDDFQSFGYFTLTSASDGYAYGFEWLLQKKYSRIPCYGQISIAYSKSVFKAGNGIEYPGQFDQRWIANISGGYKFNDKWEISTKYRFFTGAPYTPVYRPNENPLNPGEIQNLPEEYLTKRVASQGILDVRVDRYFTFDAWRVVVFLDIQNILNNRLILRPTYDFWEDKIESRQDIGILPSLGISAEF
jgi:hypothetical protein